MTDPDGETVVHENRAEPDIDFDEIYRREGRHLWAALFAFTGGDRGAAEDAVAESFVLAMEHARGIRDPVPYLYKTAFRCALADMKARKRTIPAEALAYVDQHGDLGELMWALNKLSPGQRAAVVLHYELGFPVAEVAAICRTTTSTAKVQLHLGRKKLRALLGSEEVGDA